MLKFNKKPLIKRQIINLLKKLKFKNKKFEKIKLINSQDRYLSNSIKSKINLPPFKNSAVDGYAIRDRDLNMFNIYKIKYRLAAGNQKNEIFLLKGECARIFTGARMPLNSRSVVMQEDVKVYGKEIKIRKKINLGQNCRFAGEDIFKGNIVLQKGQKIQSKNISLIAAIGKKQISVSKKLNVGYFTSGNELLNPTENLKGSAINNSNKYILHIFLNKNYLKSKYLGVLKDSKNAIIKSLMKAVKNHEVIITTGGASVGEEDHLIQSINKKGKILFWKAAIKPGRPFAIGKINNTIIICLPGNPVSVYLLYGMIVKPYIEYLCSSKFILPKSFIALVNFSMKKKTNRLEWIRVNIAKKTDNLIYVNKYQKQGSGMISSISYCDGIIEVPENINLIKKGDKFSFYPFNLLFNSD